MDDPDTMESAAESAVASLSGGMSPEEFVDFVWQTWTEGGWLMIPLAALALLIYFEAMSLILRLGKAKVKKTSRETWSKWLDKPSDGVGHIG